MDTCASNSTMTPITFTVSTTMDSSPRDVWNIVVDWKSHERWIPVTKVDLGAGNPTANGFEFTSWTGIGPLKLEDRMRVTDISWDEATETGYCEVKKLGPILSGKAWFSVGPHPQGSALEWVEDVRARFVPPMLRRVMEKSLVLSFRLLVMRRLAQLAAK